MIPIREENSLAEIITAAQWQVQSVLQAAGVCSLDKASLSSLQVLCQLLCSFQFEELLWLSWLDKLAVNLSLQLT